MDRLFDLLDSWLVDVYLLASVLITLGFAGLSRLRQPSRRMAVARSVVIGLAVLAVLAAIPGWPRSDRSGWSSVLAAPSPDHADSPRAIVPMAEMPSSPGEIRLETPPIAMAKSTVAPAAPPSEGPARRVPVLRVPSWRSIVAGSFLLGWILNIAWLAIGAIEAARLRRSIRPFSPRLLALLEHTSGEGSRRPRAGLSGRIGFPVAFGLFRPMIVLPDGFAEREPDGRVEAVLAHELAHIRNGDLRWLAVLRLLQIILFAHPLFWWLRRSIHADQETLADAVASGRCGDGRLAYAETLIVWARSSRGARSGTRPTAALALWERPTLLQRRVRVLLDRGFRVEPASPRAWRWGAAAVGLAGAVGLSLISVRPGTASSQEMPARPKEGAPRMTSASRARDPSERFEFAGRVLDPDGKPVAGAKLYLAYFGHGQQASPVRATSDSQGHFRFSLGKGDFNADAGEEPWFWAQVVATADGFGLGWSNAHRGNAAGDDPRNLTIRLKRDDLPIEGRIVDLEGRPVAGATIRPGRVLEPERGDLSDWIAALRSGGQGSTLAEQEFLTRTLRTEGSGLPTAMTTDPDGRFSIRGIGPERVVAFEVSGPTIQTKWISVLTRAIGQFQVNRGRGSADWGIALYYGARFTHAAAPTKPVVGVVKDRDTGKPLAGVRIAADRTAEFPVHGINGIETTTDRDGRYRLIGLLKGRGNQVLAIPAEGQPYLAAGVDIPDSPGLEPVTLDVGLKRGIVIEGRVTDKETGEPLNAVVEYNAFRDNPHLAEAPGFDRARIGGQYRTELDGTYRVVGLPGHGLVSAFFLGLDHRYLQGIGVGFKFNPDEVLVVPNSMQHVYHTLAEINLPKNSPGIRRDLALEPGFVRTVRVVDPDGRPVAGARVQGHTPYSDWSPPQESAELRVEGLRRGERRRLHARLVDGKLAGSVEFLADEPSVVELKLQPWATVVGRLVDEDGEPRPRAVLVPEPLFDTILETKFATDTEGRIRIEGLIPGHASDIWVSPISAAMSGKLARKLVLAPGEVRDLGDATETR